MELYQRLLELKAQGKIFRIGLVGCGQMGSGLIHVTEKMPAITTAAVADINPNRPLAEFEIMGVTRENICVTNHVGEAEDALRRGKYLVTEDALMLTQLDSIYSVIEATGDTEIGAKVAWSCVLNRKNIVMLNVETDITIGYFLSQTAKKVGSLYTVAAGDEPAVCKMLYDFARTLGFEVVALGKGKNNPIDYDATPEMCAEEAASKSMNPKMLASFKDGTKTMVEMAAVSNATGLLPDVPGMHGPNVSYDDLTSVFIPVADGGILTKKGCVEYSTGPIAPGVFAIVTTDDPRIHSDMRFVSMGPGPYYKLVRPFHLCNIETPIAVAEAAVYGERTVVASTMNSEVVAMAKRNLKPGEMIGSIGSADIFNRIYTYADASAAKAVPMGIAPGAKVTRPIAKGEMLTEENTTPDASKLVYQLRRMQNDLLAMEAKRAN